MSFGKNLQYLRRLNAYKTLMDYMKVNGLIHDERNDVCYTENRKR